MEQEQRLAVFNTVKWETEFYLHLSNSLCDYYYQFFQSMNRDNKQNASFSDRANLLLHSIVSSFLS